MSNAFKQICEFIKSEEFTTAFEAFKSSKEPEKEWEIVAYKNQSEILNLDQDGCYRSPAYTFTPAYAFDPKNNCAIHSVRRLSDGQIFSVGDRVGNGHVLDMRITRFAIFNGDLEIGHENHGSLVFRKGELSKLRKLPTVLFTTADGVEINPANPNRIYPVDKDFGYVVTTLTEYNKDAWGNHKVFSTREAAETYIVNSKPCLSVEDVRSICAKGRSFVGTAWLVSELTKLVKSNL